MIKIYHAAAILTICKIRACERVIIKGRTGITLSLSLSANIKPFLQVFAGILDICLDIAICLLCIIIRNKKQ
jgi:hypothetical protein